MLNRYWKEIFYLLLLKAILFSGIWYKCFKHPIKLDDKAAAQHILD